jgi:hypothetical protein
MSARDTSGGVDREAVAAFIESGGEGEQFEEPGNQPDPSAEPATPNDDDNTPDPSDPLFRELPDFSDLDPAQKAYLEKRVNDWRSDYTNKTTKLADANRILTEAGGDPQAVLDAYEFAQALQNDPEVRARLFQALEAEQRQQQPNPQEQVTTTDPADPLSEYDLPPEILNTLKAVPGLESRLAAFEEAQAAAQQEQFQQQYLQEVVEDLSGQWDKITEAYPDLLGANQEEAREIEEEIFAYAAHTNGNLAQATDLWRRAEARAQARLYEGSVNVPGGLASPPIGAGHSTEPPAEIKTFKDLREPVTEFLQQYMNQD